VVAELRARASAQRYDDVGAGQDETHDGLLAEQGEAERG
jgi:hypothetical protein